MPIAFFSRKLSATEKNYSAFDRELLGSNEAIKHFRHFFEARPFTLYTDHKPLTYALPSASERSPHQARHLSFIAEFTSDIQHNRGKHNVVADALSRVQTVTTLAIDLYQLAMDLTNSEEIEAYPTSITGLELQDVPFQDVSFLCDVSLGKPRPVLPRSWTYRVFEAVHS